MCSRGEHKQDACTRVSQDETRPASPHPFIPRSPPPPPQSLPVPRRHPLPRIHWPWLQKMGKPCHTAQSNTEAPCPKLSDDWAESRRPSAAEESDENASGCVSDTAFYFNRKAGTIPKRHSNPGFIFPYTGLLGWWVKLQHRPTVT